jgi:hypothetical protein
VPLRQCHYQCAARGNEGVRRSNQSAARSARKGSDSPFDFGLVTHRRCHEFDSQRCWNRSKLTQIDRVVGCGVRVKQDRCPLDVGRHLFEHLQPFSHHGVVDEREARNVAARAREAYDQALTDWIGDDSEDDRDGARRLL